MFPCSKLMLWKGPEEKTQIKTMGLLSPKNQRIGGLLWGHCKSWTLDCGLEHGLDYGLRYGLHFGLLYGENESVLSQLNYCKLPWTGDGSLED